MSARSLLIRQLPCIACQLSKQGQPSPTEEHHLNLGGKAGQKRRGDNYSVPLCGWHHRASIPLTYLTAKECSNLWGPSLARSSISFRRKYGSDEELLNLTNQKLETL